MQKIKVNDKVIVTSGKDKGKSGKVVQILPVANKLVVEGVNLMYKHLRSRKKGEKGQRVQYNGPLAISKVMLVCPKCDKNVRVGIKDKSRFCKKCREVID